MSKVIISERKLSQAINMNFIDLQLDYQLGFNSSIYKKNKGEYDCLF